MSSFTTPLIVSPMPDGRTWRLHRSFKYHVGSKYNKNIISVPAGFVTDFASIPWFFWTFLPYWGKYGKASVLHDFCYSVNLNNRKWADKVFKEAMIVGGTPAWKANLMYYGVRIIGYLSWQSYKRKLHLSKNSKPQRGQI